MSAKQSNNQKATTVNISVACPEELWKQLSYVATDLRVSLKDFMLEAAQEKLAKHTRAA